MGLFCIAQAQMSGLYTIGGANPDYADLHAAIADLQLLGMSGSATLEVQPGTYSGLHIIDNIAGLSATSRLTITASDPTLRDAHFSNDGQVFAISSDHVSMVGLDITSGGAAPYASDAVIWTDAEGVELIDCTITMQDCSPYVFIDGDDVSNILLDGLDLVGVAGVTGCLISTGIQMEGTGIEIRDCSITDTRYAIQISGSDDITIQD